MRRAASQEVASEKGPVCPTGNVQCACVLRLSRDIAFCDKLRDVHTKRSRKSAQLNER